MKFGSASRMGKSSPALLTNAPLYNPDFQTVRTKSPNFSFGSKPVVSNKNNTPAPGDYNPKDNFSSTQPVFLKLNIYVFINSHYQNFQFILVLHLV